MSFLELFLGLQLARLYIMFSPMAKVPTPAHQQAFAASSSLRPPHITKPAIDPMIDVISSWETMTMDPPSDQRRVAQPAHAATTLVAKQFIVAASATLTTHHTAPQQMLVSAQK
jgi:hypothetical protein